MEMIGPVGDRLEKEKTILKQELQKNIEEFLRTDQLADGMKFHALEQAARVEGKDFRSLLDFIYNISDKIEAELAALKKINDLCANENFCQSKTQNFADLTPKALTSHFNNKLAADELVELSIAAKQYVLDAISKVSAELNEDTLHKEIKATELTLAQQKPNSNWRLLEQFRLTIAQILEVPLSTKNRDDAEKLEFIRNRILQAEAEEEFALARVKIGSELMKDGTSLNQKSSANESIARAFQSVASLKLTEAGLDSAFVLAAAEVLASKDSDLTLADALLVASELKRSFVPNSKSFLPGYQFSTSKIGASGDISTIKCGAGSEFGTISKTSSRTNNSNENEADTLRPS